MQPILIVVEFFRQEPILAALLVILLEIPRYSFSILAMALAGWRRAAPSGGAERSITAIVPAFNGGEGLARTLDSLLVGQEGISRIIVVNDCSSDATADVLADYVLRDPRIMPVTHSSRTGKSAALNHAASLADGELLLTVDVDTVLHPGAATQLAQAFHDPDVAVAAGNVLVSNVGRNLLTALLSLEYMLAISVGRGFLDHMGAIGCCSGAFTMIRRSQFEQVGGYNVGPGEDLELTLRMRDQGYRTRFVAAATAETAVPASLPRLFRQRMRWDRDAFAIRITVYRQHGLPAWGEPLDCLFERMDFMIFDFWATMVFPFYLLWVAVSFGGDFGYLIVGAILSLTGVTVINLLVSGMITRRKPTLLEIFAIALFPLYQGVLMRLVRFASYTHEVIFDGTRRDDFVPARVRHALYGHEV